MMYAILNRNGDVIPTTLIRWAKWMERSPQRFIRKDTLWGFTVSTVFLGLNHQYLIKKPPLWFETMIFDRWHGEYNSINGHPLRHCDLYMRRYTTLNEAIAGHEEAFAWLKIQSFCYQLMLENI